MWEYRQCYCGGDDWNWFDDKEDKRYCCVPPGDSHCTKVDQDSDDKWKYNVNCSSGVLLPWYQPCHGACTGSPVIKKNNCQYDCLARSDEVSVKQNETNNNQYEDLQNCTDSDGEILLMVTVNVITCGAQKTYLVTVKSQETDSNYSASVRTQHSGRAKTAIDTSVELSVVMESGAMAVNSTATIRHI